MDNGTRQLILCFLAGLMLGVMMPFVWTEILIHSGASASEAFTKMDFTLIDASLLMMAALIYLSGQEDIAVLLWGISVGVFIGIVLLTAVHFQDIIY